MRTHFSKIFFSCLLLLFIIVPRKGNTQELNAEITVVGQKITGIDASIFSNMQKGLKELLTNTSWTGNRVAEEEKIPCSFILTIEKVEKENTYKASLQIQASRLVFKSSYNTPLLNHRDKEIEFSYLPNTSLQYKKGGKNESNLVSVFAYYAYLIIGLEADSFAKQGGREYLKEAQNIVSLQEQSSGNGWSSADRTNNRYQIIEDYINLKELQEIMYRYHRKGLDMMVNAPKEAVETMAESIINLENTYKKSNTQSGLRLFFDAKAREIADSMQALAPEQKKKLLNTLEKIDPGHLSIYKILEK